MASSVDDRIVAMKFDNNAFEQKIAATIASLEKLRVSLDFASSTKGLQDLSSATKSFSLEGIGNQIDSVSAKFTAMSAIAFTALQSITNKAIEAGSQILTALSVAPVNDGFQEYQTNLNSIQTILSNTRADGTNLDQVNEALNLLNEYSDKTIYNFGQMTRNIGTFTAAGVDLDTSVKSIKGISNLAAISGSNAEQAASAMYQLSQALATGTLKLIDWNSVVNAGMGGEVFQKALFETGKALGTLKTANLGMTFEEWTKAGNTFRGSLEEGWLTAEVLTNTLQGFTGELTKDQLLAMKYTEQQANEILALGEDGLNAATKVKTLTQLLTTIKESIGSGWSNSFRLVIGDFEQAKELFTGLNTVASGFIKASADTRNGILQVWEAFGGRLSLIQTLRNVLWTLTTILSSVAKGFREVFPAMTAGRLLELTDALQNFTKSLIPGPKLLAQIQIIARGVFAALAIGWEIVKEVAGAFFDLFQALQNTNGTATLNFLVKMGVYLNRLKEALVDGGGIRDFFKNWVEPVALFIGTLNFQGAIQDLIDGFTWLKTAITNLFGNNEAVSTGAGIMSGAAERLAERWDWLITVGEKLSDFFSWIKEQLGRVAEEFKLIFDKIEDSFHNGDFSGVYDALNTGLFAGLILLVRNFLKDGFKFDFGQGLLENISGAFEQLTGTLSAMQTSLKADALMKIAIAIGVLTASVLVLSLIDSAALTKALTALAVGFGELATTMAVLMKMTTGPRGAASFGILAGGMILLSSAILVMSFAIKLLSTMSAEELATGLAGVAGILSAVGAAVKLMPDPSGLIRASIGITGLAVALVILSGAVKLFSTMDPDEMVQGLAGVGVGLGLLVGALRALPNQGAMVRAGLGMIGVAVGVTILGGAVKVFSMIPFDEMINGLIGVGAALAIITTAMNFMPPNLPAIGAGLILVGIGLGAVAGSIVVIGNMDVERMVQGLVGMGLALVMLAVALNAMQGALLGAAALAVASGSLLLLAGALKVMADIGFGSVVLALLGLALGITVIAGASVLLSEAVPFIAALGAALILLGIGVAALGAGAALVGAAVYLIASAIAILVDVGTDGIETFLEVMPELTKAIAASMLGMLTELIKGFGPLIEAFGGLVGTLIQVLIDAQPKFIEFIIVLVDGIIEVFRTNYPKIQALGYELLIEFLRGLSNHIVEITFLVSDIIVKFTESLNANLPEIIDSGVELLVSFLKGIEENLDKIVGAVYSIVTAFIDEVGANAQRLIEAGAGLIVNVIEGIGNGTISIVASAVSMVVKFTEALKNNINMLVQAGWDLIIGIIDGLTQSIDENLPRLREAGWNLAVEILNGISGGLIDRAKEIINDIKGVAEGMLNAVKNVFGINSPSRVMMEMAGYIAEGLAIGFARNTSAASNAAAFADNIVGNINSTLSGIAAVADNMSEFNPTITPVLDLTNVERDATQLNSMLSAPVIDTSTSFAQAQSMLQADNLQLSDLNERENKVASGPTEIKFEQTINSPTELNASDIYRKSQSLIAFAKEELEVAP